MTDCEHFQRFFDKYGLPPKVRPSCLVCGRSDRETAIQHAELPSIIVCVICRDAAATAPREINA